MSNFDEKSSNQNLENLLLYTPQGAETVSGHFKTEENIELDDEHKERSRSAIKELQMVTDLGKEYSESKDSRIPAKVSQFIRTWNNKFLPDVNFEVSPIDQREFYGFWNTTIKVWEELDEASKQAAGDLATKVITNELAFFVNKFHQKKHKGGYSLNFNAYSNMNLLAACAVLKNTDSEFAKETINTALNGEMAYDRKGVFEQIDYNINPDGSSKDFDQRDSVHYHIFNQIALEKTLKICDYLGIEIPSNTTNKIKSGRNFANQYISGEKTHVEFVNSKNTNDAERFANRVGKNFDPKLDSYVVNEFLETQEEDFGK